MLSLPNGEHGEQIGPPSRPRPRLKLGVHLLRETFICVYRCETTEGWTVIATNYGLTKNIACARAEATARTIATEYGDIIEIISGQDNLTTIIESEDKP